jgi:hypothetical protein
MVTKESLARKAAKVARIIPGISSYQDKEKLRDIDKRLRTHIASILTRERSRIEDLKAQLAKAFKLDPLDDIDALTRRMHKLADTITYAAYGYASLFDQASVDKKRLEELHAYDTSLEEEISVIKGTVDNLVGASELELAAAMRAVDLSLEKLEEKLRGRDEFLKQVK